MGVTSLHLVGASAGLGVSRQLHVCAWYQSREAGRLDSADAASPWSLRASLLSPAGQLAISHATQGSKSEWFTRPRKECLGNWQSVTSTHILLIKDSNQT